MAGVGHQPAAQSVAWVPDAEVNNCPVCGRAFGITVRKHHCRVCGKVVCSRCSDNALPVPLASGRIKQERVCDPCFELRRNNKTATLTENQSNLVQVEQSLKADLKLKHQQAEWFRNFLVAVSAHAVAPSGGSSGSAEAASQEPSGSSGSSMPVGGAASAGRSELQRLIASAGSRWKDVCSEVKRSQAETDQVRRECEELERKCQRHKAAAMEVKKAVRSKEDDRKRRPDVELRRDQLALRVRELERELEGLQQRQRSLEASRPVANISFLSNWSGSSGSFHGSITQVQERVQGCVHNCRQQ